jgi:DNA mismatch repair protein MutL
VRFHERWPLERAVEDAVRRALGQPSSAATFGRRAFAGGPVATPATTATADGDVSLLRAPEVEAPPLFADAPAPAAGTPGVERAPAAGAAPAAPAPAVEPEPVVPPLLQLRRTYMMFEHEDGVVLIDQHSAHERVLYEEFMGALAGGQVPAQRLLFPLTLHLGPAEADAFEAHQALFERIGYEVEGFGGHTLLVRAVPMPHPRFDAERCLRESLDALTGARTASGHASHERLAATVACKAAVKAGDALSAGEMRALFVALARTTLPAHDVHGRATIVHLGWDELERRFGRR